MKAVRVCRVDGYVKIRICYISGTTERVKIPHVRDGQFVVLGLEVNGLCGRVVSVQRN